MQFFYRSPDNKTNLLDAAAEVASSMKGLEEEVFADLASQIEKLDVTPKHDGTAVPSRASGQ